MTETNENRSAAEIEREIDAERAEIHRTLDELRGRMSVGTAVESLLEAFRERGGEAGQQLGTAGRNFGRALRDNPVPLALIGAGVALMFAGGGPSYDRMREGAGDMGARLRGRRRQDRPHGDPGYGPWGGGDWDDDWSDDDEVFASRDPYLDLYDEELYGEDPYLVPNPRTLPLYEPEPLGASDHQPTSGTPGTADPDHRRRSRSRETIERLRDQAQRRLGAAGEGVAGATAGAREEAAHVSSELRDRAEQARLRAAETARAARVRAAEARDALSRHGRNAARRIGRAGRVAGARAQDFVHDQPLAAGAIALAVGAALGSAIANTRAENRLMGDTAERVRDDAFDVLVTEARKARRIAEAAAEEAVRLAEEASGESSGEGGTERTGDIAGRAADTARAAAGRIADRAQTEAERENLGKPGKGPA